MKKHLLYIFFLLLATHSLSSQTSLCPPNTPPAESCETACVVCGLNGFAGINNGAPSGGNTLCGSIALHNDQWMGFFAESSTISINVKASNCQNGDGLQIAFIEDCSSPDAIQCNPGTLGGGSLDLVMEYNNFTEGETYYLVVDGFNGDVCDYQIEVLSGSVGPCVDILKVCGDSCLTVCDSVFCGEGLSSVVCPDSIYSFFLQRASPKADILGGGTITCDNPILGMTAQNPNGNPIWLDNLGVVQQTGSTFIVDEPGYYTLRVTDGLCVAEDKALVKQNNIPPPVTAIGGIINPGTGTIQLMSHSIISGVKYLWTGPNGFTSMLKKPIVSVPGLYTLTVTNPQTGCSNSIVVEVSN